MEIERAAAVDAYFERALLPADATLDEVLRRSEAAGLPAISVSPLQGMLLYLLARASGARRVLEIGTLGGYSACWLARALPSDGRLVTLERDPAYAEVARANLAAIGVADRVDVLVGPALDTLHSLDAETFDLVFVDADKASTPAYAAWSVDHLRGGGLLVVDNVVRRGAVLDDRDADENVAGIRAFVQWAGAHPRLRTTAVQTVGTKGYDGFALAVVE